MPRKTNRKMTKRAVTLTSYVARPDGKTDKHQVTDLVAVEHQDAYEATARSNGWMSVEWAKTTVEDDGDYTVHDFMKGN